jgi:hypothetical protein
MPLQKQSPRSENRCKFLFPAAFFRVTRREVDDDSCRIYVTVRGFADKEAATLVASAGSNSPHGPSPDGNQGHIVEERVTIAIDDLPEIDAQAADPQLDQIERHLLTLNQFTGAIRV